MFKKEMKQICKKCKGSGIDKNRQLKDRQGRIMLAPTYEKGEGDRPQFENCRECQGSGWTMQPSPTEIVVDGEKQVLEGADYKARYEVTV